ncbi:MAG: hypothetical protein CL454_01870 [Acidimicrobiaceae bacterium]|nr:hypothetical protein [Acidimicrobiaceae bacterium]|tara:strand:+ start:110 stop:505 length:396 start_codon:yes stop_codon:yes gene_type:complete
MEFVTAIESYFENILSNKKPDVAKEILTSDIRCVLPTGDVSVGIEPILEAVKGASSAFPHRGISLDKIIVQDTTAAVVYTLAMKHIGDYGDYKATGKTVTITGVDIFEFDGEKISSISVFYNPEIVLQQIS